MLYAGTLHAVHACTLQPFRGCGLVCAGVPPPGAPAANPPVAPAALDHWPQDTRSQTGFVLEQLQQQAVDLGQAVSGSCRLCKFPRLGDILPGAAALHLGPAVGKCFNCRHTVCGRGVDAGRCAKSGTRQTANPCVSAAQAAAMPMRVQRIESTMALLETGDLKLRVRHSLLLHPVRRG